MGWACVPPIAEGLAVCEVPHDTPRLVLGEQIGRRASAGLFLEVKIAERLPVVIADDEAGSFASSSVHGGGKRRAVEMRLGTRAQSFSTGIG
jgi:hypothetical protein